MHPILAGLLSGLGSELGVYLESDARRTVIWLRVRAGLLLGIQDRLIFILLRLRAGLLPGVRC